jgi:hypothetical protein
VQVRADIEARRRAESEAAAEREKQLQDVMHKQIKDSMLKTKGGLTNKAAAVMGDEGLHK